MDDLDWLEFVFVWVILCNDMPPLKVIILGYVVPVGGDDGASLCLRSGFAGYSNGVLCLLRNLVRTPCFCCCCHVAHDYLCSSCPNVLRENYLECERIETN